MSRRRVESFEQARWITQLYRRRWVIEQLFRTIKSKGFDIERVSMETAPFTTLCAMTLVAGVSCMQMVQDRDGAAARPLRDVFEDQDRPALEAVSATLEAVSATLEAVSATLEGKTEKQKNPHPKGSLAFAAWVCARLGGWTAYYGKPGPVVMLHGLYQFRAIQRGYRINHDVRIQ
ncbi:MAG: transposase [Alphaproteobacteria bacterium]|nr:transposase [Alphaproteobacteria bacterium]